MPDPTLTCDHPRVKPAVRTHVTLVVLLALLAVLGVLLLPAEDLPDSRGIIALVAVLMAAVYGGLGWAGYLLSRRLGFADTWSRDVDNIRRFLFPAAMGLAAGLVLIALDAILHLGDILEEFHPPFPIVASASAAIGEEFLFRLFLLPVLMWALLLVMRRQRELAFWIAAVIAALAFSAGHIPAALLLLDVDDITGIPTKLLVLIIVGNCLIGLPAAWLFRKYGFLAAVGVHFWTDVVWHVAWGAMATP